MKTLNEKNRLFSLLLVIMALVCTQSVYAYDFIGKARNGSNLYFNITTPEGSDVNTVELTYASATEEDGVIVYNKDNHHYAGAIKFPTRGKIEHDGKEYILTGIGDHALEGCTELSYIDLPLYCTTIGKEAFKDCKSLRSVEMLTFLTSIGESAFEGCSSLTYLEIYGQIEEQDYIISIGKNAFKNCSGMEALFLDSCQPDKVTIHEEAFTKNDSGIIEMVLYVYKDFVEDFKQKESCKSFSEIKGIEIYPTGIRNLHNNLHTSSNTQVYSLDGRLLDSNSKGIVIKGGKKMIRQ